MKFTTSLLSIAVLAVGSASAQNATSTITITPGCPSAPADVMVTRSGVLIPSCAAGNDTVTVKTMSPTMTMGGGSSATGGSAQFTGAATNVGAQSFVALVGGVVAAMLV